MLDINVRMLYLSAFPWDLSPLKERMLCPPARETMFLAAFPLSLCCPAVFPQVPRGPLSCRTGVRSTRLVVLDGVHACLVFCLIPRFRATCFSSLVCREADMVVLKHLVFPLITPNSPYWKHDFIQVSLCPLHDQIEGRRCFPQNQGSALIHLNQGFLNLPSIQIICRTS